MSEGVDGGKKRVITVEKEFCVSFLSYYFFSKYI